MFERIIEIIVYVISELKLNKQISEIDVDQLHELGYTNSEISTAFSWLVDRMEFSDQMFTKDETSSDDSFRILHEAERELFTQDAIGELIQLHSLGILTNEHIESLIERALITGMDRIDSSGLKSFVAGMIFNAHPSGGSGNRILLRGNDTIH